MINKKKVLAIASAGGHWTQLKMIEPAFSHHSVHYITTYLNRSVRNTPNLSRVIDADMSMKLKLPVLAIQVACLLIWHRPEIVISTGAAPGFFAVMFGKLIGAKTLWIDSMANFSELSMSGRQAQRFCDLCLTQWPDLADGKQVKHFGNLL